MDRLPDIRNGIALNFDTSNFVNNVKRKVPIELTIDIVLLNRENRDTLLLEYLRTIEDEEEFKRIISEYTPTIHIGMFRSERTYHYLDDLLGINSDSLKNRIIQPFNKKLIDILKEEFALDEMIVGLNYKEVEELTNLKDFINRCDSLIIEIFDALNRRKKDYIKLLVSTYEDLGFLLNRAYVATNLRYPDRFLEYDEDEEIGMVGIFVSDFMVTYLYPNGYEDFI